VGVILTEVVVLALVVKAVTWVMRVKTIAGKPTGYLKARLVAENPAKG
jgi:hypothetical protein